MLKEAIMKSFSNIKGIDYKEEKRIISANKTEVNELNGKNIVVIASALFVVCALFVLVSLVVPRFAVYTRPCTISLALPLCAILLQVSGIELSPVISMYGVYTLLVLFSAVLSSLIAPERVCVVILIGIILFPTVYVDYSRRVNTILVIGAGVYIAIIWSFKPPDILRDEIINVFIFATLGAILGGFLRNSQLKSIDMKHQLELKASVDALTQIANRASFEEITTGLKDSMLPVALVLVDVDGFKSINDTYGHMVGDEMLKRVAALLKEYFRLTDTAVRLGGDEFAVVMPGSTEEAYDMICGRLNEINRRLQEEPVNGCPPSMISAGVAFSERGYKDELYRFSDKALYESKKGTENKVRKYENTL